MKKKTGRHLVERYDAYGHKLKLKKASGYITGKAMGKKHMLKHPQGSAVVTRVLWNSIEADETKYRD